MAVKGLFKVLVIGLVLALPLVNARARRGEDGDPDDDDEQFQALADQANKKQQEADQANEEQQDAQDAEVPSGPQLPQLIQKPAQLTIWPPVPNQAKLLQKPAIPPAINAPAPAAAPQPTVADVVAHAKNAKEAASVARQAAKVANKVAKHSVKVTGHAKKALKHALGALHDARVDSSGLDKRQKDTLKKAEAHLREATKTAEHGELKKLKDAQDLQKKKMEEDLKKRGGMSEKEQMRQEIEELRQKLKQKKVDDKDIYQALDELEADIEKTDGPINDESKAELERLRRLIESLEDVEEPKQEEPQPDHEQSHEEHDEAATPVSQKGLDIDTEMPYGDLEPFGREDTAQELTESSIKESDEMVDQLERAEVAEEKRSVFRALTRLRGAAITSFDGVARSQTGNIDEYNKIHQWRNTHPLHHLADEESDVSKWAFPDNAD